MRGAYLIASALFIGGCGTVKDTSEIGSHANIHKSEYYNFPNIELEVIGKDLATVIQSLGNPGLVNRVGGIVLLTYSRVGENGYGYSNICFLEIQADADSQKVSLARTGSNLGIDNIYRGLNVRKDCNRVYSLK